MKLRHVLSLVLSFVFVLQPIAGFAFETDQFKLPPVPLADIGDEVSEYVTANLRASVDKINADILIHKACLDTGKAANSKCGDAKAESEKLKSLTSNDAVAKELFGRIGDGSIFKTKFGKWIDSHQFRSQPSSYKSDYTDSIYVLAPANYVTISPTINMFGIDFGTDKLEHFFQQGYKYYTIKKAALAKGENAEKANLKAVKWGQKTERTYYGLLVSGVYSNADLYANYAGMRFYEGLTQPVTLGEITRPAMVTLDNGQWKVSADMEKLLKPFISDHLNEALNPSGYAFTIYSSVKCIVRKHDCPDWRTKFPNLTVNELNKQATDLELWNDEDYGNMPKGRLLKIADVCYSSDS